MFFPYGMHEEKLMRNLKAAPPEKKSTRHVYSRIKNSDLVGKKQLLIAKSAAKLFSKKGYQQTTMREISRATGMAMGNLYDYISKKEDVLCLVFDVYHKIVEESSLGPEVMKVKNPLERLRSNLRISIKNVHDFHNEIVLMYRESQLLPKKDMDRAKKMELDQIRAMEKLIRMGVKQGLFKVKDPYFAASMIFFQLVMPALRGWTFRGKYSKKKIDGLIEDYILKNILA